LKTLFSVDFVLQIHELLWAAEAFNFARGSLSGDSYAVVDYAAENAGAAVDAQVLCYSNFASFPEQGIRWTCFDAELAFDALTGFLVYCDASFWEILAYVKWREKLGFSLFLFVSRRFSQEFENVSAFPFVFRHQFHLSTDCFHGTYNLNEL